MTPLFVANSLLPFVTIAAALYLFARRLPRRENFRRRVAVSCVALAVVYVAVTRVLLWASTVPASGEAVTLSGEPTGSSLGFVWYATLFITFSLVLVLGVVVVKYLFTCNLRAAAFCVTAGYTMQNLASGTDMTARLIMDRVTPVPMPIYVAVALACYAVVYAIAYRLFIRKLDGQALGRSSRVGLYTIVVVIFAVIGFDVVNKNFEAAGTPLPYLLALRLFHGAVCVFLLFSEYEVLYNSNLRVEVATTERLLADQEHQYRQSLSNIDAINMKCHDIRHQIRELRDGGAVVDGAVLDDIAREVNVYDSKVKTGNEALDTILTEKNLICQREGIALTCIADGTCLMFMPAAELYAFFGNALDNAIEAARKVPDPDQRNISVDVRKRLGMASIHVENRYVGELQFRDGLPLTTKGDRTNHGFGTRSMRETVQRHGGTFTTSATDGVFQLNALVPIPTDWAQKL